MTAEREPGPSVLIVEDDDATRSALRRDLMARGYRVDDVRDGGEALLRWEARRPDAVLVDLGLPDMDGTRIIARIRREATTPILVISARDAEATKVEALELGADDYVTKPFGMGELLARLRASLRRESDPDDEQPVITTDDFVIDLSTKRVTDASGEEIRLTPTEWGILEMLVHHRGKLVTQTQLLKEVWGPQYGQETNYLRVFIAQLRRKLEPQPSMPRYFITEAGMGYRFETPDKGDSTD